MPSLQSKPFDQPTSGLYIWQIDSRRVLPWLRITGPSVASLPKLLSQPEVHGIKFRPITAFWNLHTNSNGKLAFGVALERATGTS